MDRFARFNNDMDSCLSHTEVLDRVKEEVKKGPPSELDTMTDAPGRIYSDPGLALDMFVANIKNSGKRICWTKSTVIERDGYIIESSVKITPCDSVMPSLVAKLCKSNPSYDYIDIPEGGPIDMHKFHRFVVYNKYTPPSGSPEEIEEEAKRYTRIARCRAEALVQYVNDIHQMKDGEGSEYDTWLMSKKSQAMYHIVVGLLLGYTFNDISEFLHTNKMKWPVAKINT
jgi:hypothetical protein